MSGFGNSFETEALPGALPIGRNSPQRCRYGLYAEQLSGSPFTAPRSSNERSWLYRIRPSVKHSGRFGRVDMGLWRTAPCHEHDMPIGQLRWGPQPLPKKKLNFLEAMRTMTTGGDAATLAGHGRACLSRDALDARRIFLQRRWRDAGRAAARKAAHLHGIRPHRDRAWRDRRHSARREVARRAPRLARRAAICARITGAPSRCRSVGRSARTASPIRAIS